LRSAEPAILKLEEKWHAVSLLTEAREKGNGHVSNELASEIGKKFDVTGDTVRVWAARAEQGQYLMRNDGSGYLSYLLRGFESLSFFLDLKPQSSTLVICAWPKSLKTMGENYLSFAS
jgi:hypothetical protein